MTFTVTPQPNNVPPRVRIDVNTDDPAKSFASLAIRRDGQLLREQPFIGSQAAVLYDYEAPFGTPSSYSVEGSTVTPSAIYSTAWPNLTGWTTASGSPAVASSRLVASTGTAVVERTVSLPSAGRLEIPARPVVGGPARIDLGAGLSVFTNSVGASPKWWVQFGSAGAVAIAWTSGGLTAQWTTAGATFTTATDSKIFTNPWVATSNVVRVSVTNPAEFGGFTVSAVVSPTPFAAAASTSLNVVDTWLIHPSQPSLSIPIYSHQSADGVRYIEASSGEQKSSAAVSTVHRPIGRRRPVVITSGPRQADEWTLVVESLTIAAKNALRAIVDDQTPLLLRSPADVVMDLPDDWYSVGDVTVSRVEVPVITQRTLMTMPLTPVDEPVVRVGALWTWGDVLTTYSTWQELLNLKATWLDVLAGPSS